MPSQLQTKVKIEKCVVGSFATLVKKIPSFSGHKIQLLHTCISVVHLYFSMDTMLILSDSMPRCLEGMVAVAIVLARDNQRKCTFGREHPLAYEQADNPLEEYQS